MWMKNGKMAVVGDIAVVVVVVVGEWVFVIDEREWERNGQNRMQ